ncbi:MAG: glycosyltransferase family 2 protein [Cyanophyceae cyanobacterium]
MEKQPTVSILINNYNYGQFLGKAIDSVLSQSYAPVEVVVVDDGSTDNSRDVINSYGSQIIPVLKANGGQASAFNAGFIASRGEVICLLDSDDFFLEEKVAEVVKIFEAYSDVSWCFHTLELVDVTTGEFLGKSRERESRLCDFRIHARRGKVYFYAPATSGLSFKRSLLQKILPMAEKEETKLCADRYVSCAAVATSQGFYLDQALAVQGIHGSNGFNFNQNIDIIRSRSALATACSLRDKFPELIRYTNREFANGLSGLWKSGEIEPPYTQAISEYWSALSLIEKLEIIFWTAYRSIPRKRTARHRMT